LWIDSYFQRSAICGSLRRKGHGGLLTGLTTREPLPILSATPHRNIGHPDAGRGNGRLVVDPAVAQRLHDPRWVPQSDRCPIRTRHTDKRTATMDPSSGANECLDRVLIWNRRHLEGVLVAYVRHYNTARPHRALHLGVPATDSEPAPASLAEILRIERVDVLGGLVHEYRHAA
jgi:hypothetical protein